MLWTARRNSGKSPVTSRRVAPSDCEVIILFERNHNPVSLIFGWPKIERNKMKRAIASLVMVGLTTAAFAAAEVGKPAPDFTGTDINGKTVKLSDYKGKIVVLESYNIECPFCANHFKTGAMQQLQKDMTSQGIVWIM